MTSNSRLLRLGCTPSLPPVPENFTEPLRRSIPTPFPFLCVSHRYLEIFSTWNRTYVGKSDSTFASHLQSLHSHPQPKSNLLIGAPPPNSTPPTGGSNWWFRPRVLLALCFLDLLHNYLPYCILLARCLLPIHHQLPVDSTSSFPLNPLAVFSPDHLYPSLPTTNLHNYSFRGSLQIPHFSKS